MKQADVTNIIIGPWAHASVTPSPIERLWEKYKAAASEKTRVYALWDEAWERTASGDPADDAACDLAEAACDAAFDAFEDAADEILRGPVTTKTDLGVKARVLKQRDHGNGHRRDDVERFCRDVQIVAGARLP